MKQRLVIMSAGKNTRFNSEEKIFAKINDLSNLENTCRCADGMFDRIFLAVDRRWFKKWKKVPPEVQILDTIGGKGDIYSIYYALKGMKGLKPEDIVTVCWGDAVFASELPFKELLSQYDDIHDTFVAVARDHYPYAWFDVDGEAVAKASFRKDDGDVPIGIHDQSLFGFRARSMDLMNEYISIPSVNEYKTLKYFEWLYDTRSSPAVCRFIAKDNVKSFNT